MYDISRFVFSILEALIYIFTIHFILPRQSRLDLKQNALFFAVILMGSFFLLQDNILTILLFNTILIVTLIFINNINVYIASITMVITYISILIASLITIIFSIYFYNDLMDFRFVLEGNQYQVIFFKYFITALVVYVYKVFNSLFNRKTQIQKINPRPVVFMNIIYLIGVVLISCEIIEYIPTIYQDMIQIEALSKLLFTSIMMAYVASVFVLYILNVYLFKSSDYLSIKLSSETDALTGVLNRKAGINHLKERMQNIQVKKGFLTVCFIDVNNLKVVNDRFGHKLGDDLIKNTSRIIMSALREHDQIARLGGDEFLVIFDQCSIEQAVRAWDRIIDKFEAFNITSDSAYDISVSVGFSEYNHKMNITHDALIEIADGEMYKNKEQYKRMKGISKNGKW